MYMGHNILKHFCGPIGDRTLIVFIRLSTQHLQAWIHCPDFRIQFSTLHPRPTTLDLELTSFHPPSNYYFQY